MGWVVHMIEDLRSDFSVFHRIPDLNALTADRFMSLAARIAAYDGAVAKRIRMLRRGAAPAATPGAASTVAGPQDIEALRNQARVKAHGEKAAQGGITYVSLGEAMRMSV
jgi:hypothetical protein